MPNAVQIERTIVSESGQIRLLPDDVPERGMKEITVGCEQLVICRLNGQFFVVRGICSHRGARLAEGKVSGAVLRCPWHGASFDVRTGVWLRGPACRDLKSYKAKVVDGEVVISIPSPSTERANVGRQSSEGGQGHP
jgi:nitrite reductase/ring-hydroxylating ferredoxin subunit